MTNETAMNVPIALSWFSKESFFAQTYLWYQLLHLVHACCVVHLGFIWLPLILYLKMVWKSCKQPAMHCFSSRCYLFKMFFFLLMYIHIFCIHAKYNMCSPELKSKLWKVQEHFLYFLATRKQEIIICQGQKVCYIVLSVGFIYCSKLLDSFMSNGNFIFQLLHA